MFRIRMYKLVLRLFVKGGLCKNRGLCKVAMPVINSAAVLWYSMGHITGGGLLISIEGRSQT